MATSLFQLFKAETLESSLIPLILSSSSINVVVSTFKIKPEPYHFLPLPLLPSWFSSVQFSSVSQLCPTLCNPMNCSMPGLSVHHKLPESTQTHAHQVGDAIQPSHPLSSPSPLAPNPSQHQGLFQ